MGLSANQWLGLLQSHLSQKNELEADRSHESTNLGQKNTELQTLFDSIGAEVLNLSSLDCQRAELEKENPEEQMYCGIKEFVVDNQGMCGMGMGMGSLQTNANIKMTGKELVAMSKVLNGNGNGQYSVDDLVKQLNDMGISNAKVSEDGKSISLTRPDGTCVKISDANGDGMINGCDYDFSDALAKFNQDLCAFNQKVADIEQKQTDVKDKIQGLEERQTVVKLEADNIEAEILRLDGEIDYVDHKIDEDEIGYKEALEAEKAEAEENDNETEVSLPETNELPETGVVPEETPETCVNGEVTTDETEGGEQDPELLRRLLEEQQV